MKKQKISNLIRSLSSISKVSTQQIREELKKQAIRSPIKSQKRQNQKDNNTNLSFSLNPINKSYKLYYDQKKRQKVTSFIDKYKDSEAHIKMAYYQYKKIKNKNKMSDKKKYQIESFQNIMKSYAEQSEKLSPKNIIIPKLFEQEQVSQHHQEEDQQLKQNITNLSRQSQHKMKDLYYAHLNKIQLIRVRERNVTEPNQGSNRSVQKTSRYFQDEFKEKMKHHKRHRSNFTKLKATSSEFHSTKIRIQTENKLKESLASKGLRKIIYGNQSGKYIHNQPINNLPSSSTYFAKIVQQQEKELEEFKGNFKNRRKMTEKFQSILSLLHRKKDETRKYFYKSNFKTQNN